MANTKITTDVIADGAITSAKLDTNITISGDITGTLATAAQPNITSVGTLTGFTSTGIDDNATSTAITIDSSENVGIGTGSPSQKLEVGDGTAASNWLRLNGTTSDLYIGQNTGFSHFGQTNATKILSVANYPMAYGTANAYPLIFGTSDTERMRIDSSGNVGISGQLYCNNPNSTLGGFKFFRNHTNGDCFVFDSTTAPYAGDMVFGTTNQERMRIDSSGKVGIGVTPSEGKLHVKSDGAGEVELLTLENSTGTNGKTTLTFKTTSTDATKSAQIFAERVNASGHTDLAFRTYNGSTTEAVRIDHDGNVGITAAASLRFNGTGDNTHAVGYDSTVDGSFIRGQSGIRVLTGTGSGTERMRITSSGTMGFGMQPLGTNSGSAFFDGNVSSKDGFMSTGSDLTLLQPSAGNSIFVRDNGNETMRIASNGRISMGTTTANAGLTVANGDIRTTAAAVANDANSFSMSQESSGGTLCARGPNGSTRGTIQLSVNEDDGGGGIVGLFIANDGNPCVGKTTSDINTQGFHVIASGTYAGAVYSGVTGTTANSTYHVRDTTNNTWKFYVTNTGVINATSTSITSLSDERLKENIVDLETGLEEVMSLKPRRFDWKEGEGSDAKNIAGFIAQEVETVLPDLIDDFMHDDLEDAKSVKMGDMIPTLVKAIQEQQTIIDDLKTRIETLEG